MKYRESLLIKGTKIKGKRSFVCRNVNENASAAQERAIQQPISDTYSI